MGDEMIYGLILVISVLLSVGLSYYIIVKKGFLGAHVDNDMVTTLEQFAEQMAQENERVIDMMAKLRQKIDRDALAMEHQITALTRQYDELARTVNNLHSSPSPSSANISYPDLAPKYQEVAKRLWQGDDPAKIAQELQLGRGEIELVKHMIQH